MRVQEYVWPEASCLPLFFLLARVDEAHRTSFGPLMSQLATFCRASGRTNAEAEQPAAPLTVIALRIHTALTAPCSRKTSWTVAVGVFFFFFSSLSPHIFTTTATVFVVDVFFSFFFSFLFLKCSLFFLSCLDSFFPCPWVCWETGGIMFTLVAWLKTLKGTMAIMWRLIKGLDFLFLFFLPWWDLM